MKFFAKIRTCFGLFWKSFCFVQQIYMFFTFH